MGWFRDVIREGNSVRERESGRRGQVESSDDKGSFLKWNDGGFYPRYREDRRIEEIEKDY